MLPVYYVYSPRTSNLTGKRNNSSLSAQPTNIHIHEARRSAPPHHMWYEANIHQIVTAERRTQNKEDAEGLILLATSLQVCPCTVYGGEYSIVTRRQIDECRFPLRPPGNLATSGYISYWFWDLRPALRGTFKIDNTDRFCAHFLLSLNDDNHVPLYTAMFVRDICSKVRERTHLTVEFDDIAFRIESGLICGYIQFRTECLRDVLDWVNEHATIWLIDSYGPVYFEINSTVIGHHTIKAWQAIIHGAVECIFPGFLLS